MAELGARRLVILVPELQRVGVQATDERLALLILKRPFERRVVDYAAAEDQVARLVEDFDLPVARFAGRFEAQQIAFNNQVNLGRGRLLSGGLRKTRD